MFELKLKDQTVNLKWGTWAMKLFCDRKGITASDFVNTFASGEIDINNLILLIQCGVEAAKGEPVDEMTVSDWIDELGGVFQSEGPLVDYAKYVVDRTLVNVTPLPGDQIVEDVKKNE